MMIRKRITACILAAAMVVSSSQLSVVCAQELTPSVQEDVSDGRTDEQAGGAQTDGQEQENGDIGGTEKEDTQPSEEISATEDGGDVSDEGEALDAEEPSEIETPADADDSSEDESSEGDTVLNEDGNEDEENDPVDSEQELYGAQISGNDLLGSEPSEIMVVDELDGVYQFGGAPSAKGNLSVYSVSPYSNDVMDYLYQQMLARKANIDVSAYGIEASSLRGLVSGVLNEHPDLYFVYRGYSYSTSGTKVTRILFTYIDTYDDDAFRKSAGAALSCVDSQMSDVEKAVILHDYLTVNCEYDYQNYLNNSIPDESFTAYGTLVNRTAVCQGYALAYKYLLNQVGIDCYMVSSDAMNHAWNMIVLDGKYYQVDVTWDDPTWDKVGRSVHTYMFRSDAAFAKHYNWIVTVGSGTVDYTATDTRFDSAFWADCSSPLVIAGDDCYYIAFDSSSYQGSLMKRKLADIDSATVGTTVQSIGRWASWEGGGYWQGVYSGLFQIDGRLFYNDMRSIYSIAMDGTDRRTAFTADTTEGYIYGSAYCQGKVLYALHQTPNLNEKETVLTADITAGGGESPDIPEKNDGLNLDNFTAEYTALDGTKISSTADGKPKLLIFYSNNCYNCRSTIQSISRKITDFAGVDIYAIEITRGSRESVSDFQTQYGCDEIIFSYDTGVYNENSMWKYVDAGGFTNPTWPVICYIDADNRLQYVTISVTTADAVLSNLKQYCGYNAEPAKKVLGNQTQVTFKSSAYTYNAAAQEPKPVVSDRGIVLEEGRDYALSYRNNRNVGDATVIVEGINDYCGSISRTFAISPAQVVITAKDKTILIGDAVPNAYECEVSGLLADDVLTVQPTLSCGIVSTASAGQYDIVPVGADAGGNYEISYVKGRLTVASEYVSCTVTYDVQGHGTAPAGQTDIRVGSTIDRPEDPSEPGYRFDGWYKDAACTMAWNFDTDIVQSDTTLYAKWLGTGADGGFALQEIADMYYTGKALKPAVSVYDGGTLLKSGRDYQIRYYNNINANAGGVRKDGNGKGSCFNETLPYVEIIGKGNYTETVTANFNILQASIGDGSDAPAAGVTLKVTDQLVAANKILKPFSSIKYVKAMKLNTDYTLRLTVVNATDGLGAKLSGGMELENAELPAGYQGEFLLTVQGIGNYEGSISRKLQVADKNHLIKNARITLGKNLKNIIFTGEAVKLTPAEENAADVFTVKCGDTFLRYNQDYTVRYRNNDRVGKAELIITGMDAYAGSKTAAFNIKGRTFSAKTVQAEGVTDRVYTGRALTQNDARLTYGAGTDEERALKYGTDYTVSYSKNVNKGTATMTFKGREPAGFSGSFRKTFKIAADDIAQAGRSEEMKNITLSYCKAGAKPAEQIVLTSSQGSVLRNGKDYTLRYVNNKAVAGATDEKPPTVIVKGKGNYAGEFAVYFNIRQTDLRAALDDGGIQIRTSAVAYQPNKAETYAYKPAVKLMEGKTALRAGTDYEIEYVDNTQADYERYMQALAGGAGAEGDTQVLESQTATAMPQAVITEKAGAAYMLHTPIVVPLPIYQNKLTKSNLAIEVEEAVYTGGQVTPTVTVYDQGENGRVLLQEDKDYAITYGANNKSGKNAGSVTISGVAPYYGGSVTVKFEIKRKPIMY